MTVALTSWSFSRYSIYRQCPALAKYKFIDRIKEPGSPAMERGDRIHKAAESYIKGERDDLAPELQTFAAELAGLREQAADGTVRAEESWAFRSDWSVTTYDDWNGCWLRIKTDCTRVLGTHADIFDWKSGKFRQERHEEYLAQLDLYALGAFKIIPGLESVRPYLVYTDQDLVFSEHTYHAPEVPTLQTEWGLRVRAMMADTQFPPVPGNHCRWCHFRRSNGGPCKY